MIKKLFSPIFFILSLFFLTVIFYKSEINFGGINRDHYLKYYIFSFILISFSICTFYISDKTKEYLGITILSAIFTIYLIEYYLGTPAGTPQKIREKEKIMKIEIKKKIYKEETGFTWDERSQYQVYRDLLKKDPNTVPYFYPQELSINSEKIHSLAGVSNSQTVFCNENGYYSVTNSDRYGFNNPAKEWDSDEFEFVFVGDSMTHGYCVNRPNDIPSVVRELSGKSTLNLGYGRNGPLIEYATLREYLPKKTKNIIFMFYGGNDLQNLESELKNKILINYKNDLEFNQNLKDKQSEIDKQIRTFVLTRLKGIEFKYQFIKLRRFRESFKDIITKKEGSKVNHKEALKELEKILFLTKKLSIENKSKLHFVYLSAERYWGNENTQKDDLIYFDDIKNIVEKLEINFIDIHKEVFQKRSNPLELFPFGISGHYNVEGFKEVAKAIYEDILKYKNN